MCCHQTEAFCSDDPSTTPCPKPCNTPLSDCEHKCTGTCGSCRNGRLHIQCNENCKRLLICGHECQSKCSKVCPPCNKACETRCSHSKCSQSAPGKGKVRAGQNGKKGRECGEQCPLCAEKCGNHCQHRNCTKQCWEPCDVEPCQVSN